MTQKELYALRQAWMQENIPYQCCHHSLWRYEILDNIMYKTRPGRRKKGAKPKSYNDVFIMFDTETSRKKISVSPQVNVMPTKLKARENHVVAWTISIRAFNTNIVTLYGHKPTSLVHCMKKIHEHMRGDITIMYAHNMPYDHWFIRQFLYKELGTPDTQLNIKPHYPLFMRFDNGVEIRDSLALAQRKLEKWAKDMGAEHQKAVGKWNYNKFRNQDEDFTPDEIEYIEHDTLAGVECLNILMDRLGKHIYSMPFTATGIIRSEMQEIGKANNAKEYFNRLAPTYEQYIKLTKLFHGGFTHANRFYIDVLIDESMFGLIQCFDFTSSYPFCMLAYKYQAEAFHKCDDRTVEQILHDADEYCFMFKLCMWKPHLKEPDHVMPALQYSKCVQGTCINPVIDNGRIIECDYCEIYTNEIDLEVLADQYDLSASVCVECECALKDYLPRWFTDFVYNLFYNKCVSSLGTDDVAYKMDKSKVNGCYGMTVMKSIRDIILEDYKTGEYTKDVPEDPKERIKQEKKEYKKYLDKKSNILIYSWGCWVTSYAFRNLHELNKCIKKEGLLLYNDTDSGYAAGWDLDKIKAYNENCVKLLAANNYKPIEIDGNTFTLGIAEHKPLKDDYTEFKVLGAKRYAGRKVEDGKIHITVAGVPKKGALSLDNDLNNFTKGHKFRGKQTGKLTHVYFSSPIYIDENGNETADSIDLLPCDYELDTTDKFDLDSLFEEEIEIEYFD